MIDQIASSIASQTFSGLLTNLITSYAKRVSRSMQQGSEVISTDLRNHFQNTYEKCKAVKTIINDEPIDTLSIYVDQKFRSRQHVVDQYTLIDEIRAGRSVIITGFGGGGKSMFMRYLWLSYFVHSQGQIPIFFELRNMNQLTHNSITDYIYHTIIQNRSSISQNQITSAISRGEVVLFLDGFDEVSVEKREWVESELIKLKELNPKITIVITSRPDDRFAGWPHFYSYEVEPLSKEQVLDLINKAHYEQAAKKKLYKRIDEGLYDSHRSFLSNPLLAYMMLLTISKNPDIPNKMHLFYEQAFDALYHRHDTTSKVGFVRKKYCSIDKQEFVRILSYFCLITYHDEKFEFDEISLNNYIEKAISFEKRDMDANSFLMDLCESVCILKKDGTTFDFVHRSFQEYFSALCICWIANRSLDKLLLNFAGRRYDQVLRMVYDINPDLFREKYVIPMKARFKKFFNSANKLSVSERYMHLINGRFEALVHDPRPKKTNNKRVDPDDNMIITFQNSGEFSIFCGSIIKIGHEEYYSAGRRRQSDALLGDKDFFRLASDILGQNIEDISIKSNGKRIIIDANGELFDHDGLNLSFRKTYMYIFLKQQSEFVHGRVSEETKKYRTVTSSFEEYFGD